MIDANEAALEKYFKEEEKAEEEKAEEEKAEEQLEEFNEITDKWFAQIQEAIEHIKNIASNYDNLDLDDEIKSKINELL